jgi:V/A-type H+-transporting ATPase subunit D
VYSGKAIDIRTPANAAREWETYSVAEIAPTKSNLLRLRREMAFARDGHGLLSQKKDILTVELLALVDSARAAEQKMQEVLAAAFDALRKAIVRMGRGAVSQTAPAVGAESRVSVSSRRVMGVTLPIVEIAVQKMTPTFSLGDSSVWVDETTLRFMEALKALGPLAETGVSLRRLALEVKRTIRRVNALEKIALPTFERNLKYITDALEEMEREAFFTLKLVKKRLAQRRTGGAAA